MLVSGLVDLINLSVETYDEYEPAVLIPYINYASDELSLELAVAGDQEFIKKATITTGDTVPETFVQFIPKDGYPVSIVDNEFVVNSGTTANIKYANTKPWVTGTSDTVPFRQYNIGVLVDKVTSRLHASKTLKYVVENPQVDQYVAERNITALKKAKGG
jgi:hypothetical protein